MIRCQVHVVYARGLDVPLTLIRPDPDLQAYCTILVYIFGLTILNGGLGGLEACW